MEPSRASSISDDLSVLHRVEQVLERFHAAWESGSPPTLVSFLTGSDEVRRELLPALVVADLERRLKGGISVRLEDYLKECPELAFDEELLAAVIAADHQARRKLGEIVPLDDYVKRFAVAPDRLRRAGFGEPITPTGEPDAASSLGNDAVDRIDNYEILDELGRGGMGVVYRARQKALNRIVALKMILSGEHAGQEERKRFLAEAQAVAQLRHPGIVQIYDFGMHQDKPYLTLEYCEGGSLADRLRGTPLPPRDAAEIVEQVAHAIHVAHQAGIVHRDLKPGNVLLATMRNAGDEDQSEIRDLKSAIPKIADFGLAKRVDGSGQTQTGAVMGTPSYLPPEQARGEKQVGPLADVYSLGAILYECLTGRPPFRAATGYDTLLQVVREEPVAVRLLNPQVPRDLETICLKCLQKEPARRYSSAEALAEDLRRHLDDKPILARPVGRGERLLRWCRREPIVASLLATVLLVSTVGGTISTVFAVKASRAANEARKEADRAEQNLKLAKQAIDECFNVCKDDPLFQETRMEKAKQLLLRKTLPFYQRFREVRGDDDVQSRMEEAEQWFRVAYIEDALMRVKECREAYEKSLAIRRALAESFPDEPNFLQALAGTHNNLGRLLSRVGRHEEALQHHQKAQEIRARLAASHPDAMAFRLELATTHNNHGAILAALGKRDQAAGQYRQAIEIQTKLAADHPDKPECRHDLARTHHNLGLLLMEQGKAREALEQNNLALPIFTELLASHPDNAEFAQSLGSTHYNQGFVLASMGSLQEAVTQYQEAEKYRRKLVEAFPDLPGHQSTLAGTQHNLALLLAQLGKPQEALAQLEQTCQSYGKLVASHPDVPNYQHGLALARFNQAVALNEMDRKSQALQCYQEARTLQAKLADAFPNASQCRVELGNTLLNLGVLQRDLKQPEEALRSIEQAIPLLRELHQSQPEESRYRLTLHQLHRARAETLVELGRYRDSLTDWEEVIRLNPTPANLSVWRSQRAYFLARCGEHRRAAAEVEELGRGWFLSGEFLFQLACVQAVNSVKVVDDASCPLAVRDKLAEQFARQSITLLQRAARAGLFRDAEFRTMLHDDDDLKPLSTRDDYQAFLASLPKK